jgi:hypothetical protein
MEGFEVSALVTASRYGPCRRQDVADDPFACEMVAAVLKIMVSVLDPKLVEAVADDCSENATASR